MQRAKELAFGDSRALRHIQRAEKLAFGGIRKQDVIAASLIQQMQRGDLSAEQKLEIKRHFETEDVSFNFIVQARDEIIKQPADPYWIELKDIVQLKYDSMKHYADKQQEEDKARERFEAEERRRGPTQEQKDALWAADQQAARERKAAAAKAEENKGLTDDEIKAKDAAKKAERQAKQKAMLERMQGGRRR